jgi:hypothetical protein
LSGLKPLSTITGKPKDRRGSKARRPCVNAALIIV